MNPNTVTGLATITADSDASTKAYVDSKVVLKILSKWQCYSSGNLTVSGTTTTINTETTALADNMIDLNSDFTLVHQLKIQGIRVMRGDSTNKPTMGRNKR